MQISVLFLKVNYLFISAIDEDTFNSSHSLLDMPQFVKMEDERSINFPF